MISNDWLLAWFWGLGQASIIGVCVLGLLLMARRAAPESRVRLSLIGLIVMALLPCCFWLPRRPTSTVQRSDVLGEVVDREQYKHREVTNDSHEVHGLVAVPKLSSVQKEVSPLDAWRGQLTTWLEVSLTNGSIDPAFRLEGTTKSNDRLMRLTWLHGLGIAAAVMMVWGWFRLLLGSLLLQRLYRRSKPCNDPRLDRWLQNHRAAETGITIPEWRISDTLQTPAVMGVTKPIVLLPEDWYTWDESELNAALAHELAHVRRHDVVLNLCAQFALALSYFHPLAHWLARRMQMDQELAADCLAAETLGGKQNYVKKLAELALRRTDAKVGGHALAFLPTRHSFVRRIEMLRDLPNHDLRYHRKFLNAAPWMVIVVACGLLWLRPIAAQTQAPAPNGLIPATAFDKPASAPQTAEAKVPPAEPAASESLLRYVPEQGTAVAVWMNVAQAMQSPGLQPLLQMVAPDQRVIQLPFMVIRLDDLDQVLILQGEEFKDTSFYVMLRYKNAEQVPQPAEEELKQVGIPNHVFKVDDRTILLGATEQPMLTLVKLAATMKSSTSLGTLADRHSDGLVRGAVRLTSVLKKLPADRMEKLLIDPVVNNVSTVSFGLVVDPQLTIDSRWDTDKPQAVVDTLLALRTLARNGIQGMTRRVNNTVVAQPEQIAMMGIMEALVGRMLDSMTVLSQEKSVSVSVKMDQGIPAIVGAAVPLITAVREQARQSQGMNQLKQIALALHNYESAYGHLPPAVVVENGVPRSWRVEILPFVEEADLYNQYHKDEPWDSAANRLVLEKMPQVYQLTAIPTRNAVAPYMTGIHGVGGPQGILGKGVKFSEVTDGLSQTLMVVETQDAVPWTQPEEYAVLPEQLMTRMTTPKGLHVAFGDGSCRVLPPSTPLDALKVLLTMNGGELVPQF